MYVSTLVCIKKKQSLGLCCKFAICITIFINFVLQQKDVWKSELKDFSNKNGYDINRNGDSVPLLLDVLEGFLKFEVCCLTSLYYILVSCTFKPWKHQNQVYSFFYSSFILLIKIHSCRINLK